LFSISGLTADEIINRSQSDFPDDIIAKFY